MSVAQNGTALSESTEGPWVYFWLPLVGRKAALSFWLHGLSPKAVFKKDNFL